MRESTVVAEWKAEGRAEGRAEGKVQAKREDLLRALEVRFPGPMPAELVAALAAQTDLELLTAWFDAALRTDSLDAFRTAIPL